MGSFLIYADRQARGEELTLGALRAVKEMSSQEVRDNYICH